MLVGYARVSTQDQNLNLQHDALTREGCEVIFDDKISGVREDRPGLAKALRTIEKGDTLVVYSLSRLGRSTMSLLKMIDDLTKRGVEFRSLSERTIDTGSAHGRALLTIIAALAAMERELLIERTRAGVAAAKARGREGGRPSKLTAKQIEKARKRLGEGSGTTVAAVAREMGVGRATLYRALGRID